MLSTMRAGSSASENTSARRWAGPCPSVTQTTRQPSRSQPRTSSTAAAVSPRYGSTSWAATARLRTAPASGSMSKETRSPIESRSSGASVGAAANGDMLHQARPLPKACARTSASDMYAAAPRSIGASPPPAAAAHDASRNSWLVATKSCARARTRSGSETTTCVPAGIRSTSSSMWSTRTGASDSIPSTAWPSASFSNSSASSGCSFASTAARERTSSVSSNSRQGGAHSPCWAISRDRWSATAKYRISSTSSPKKSTRSGCSSVGGKTSMMPPRTANSPRRSTRSTRW